ncbi:hypothetical protein VP1G_11330, partial [Cytospora mali]
RGAPGGAAGGAAGAGGAAQGDAPAPRGGVDEEELGEMDDVDDAELVGAGNRRA